jgi:hypothetical protein
LAAPTLPSRAALGDLDLLLLTEPSAQHERRAGRERRADHRVEKPVLPTVMASATCTANATAVPVNTYAGR